MSDSSFLENNADIDNVTDALTAVGYDLAHSEAVQGYVSDAVDSWKDSVAGSTEADVTDPYQ